MIKVEFNDYTHLIFGFGGIGHQVPDVQLAIFAYFDQYLVRFFYFFLQEGLGSWSLEAYTS